MPSTVMDHTIDPKEALLEKVGDLSDVEIFGTDVLLAVYQRPERTKSGIILTDDSRSEDRYQGKAHLILKLGPRAFVDDENYQFADNERLKVGDWCAVRPSDGQMVTLNNMKGTGLSKDNTILCRLVKDVSIRLRIMHPDRVW